jgi:hypothetical protein
MKLGSSEKKSSVVVMAIVAMACCAFLYYAGWASRISARTVLRPEIPEWTTYLLIGFMTGLVALTRTRLKRSEGKTALPSLNSFMGGFCLGFIFSINIYATATYILPGEVINYESAFEITYPGPASGKSSHCEAGLWITDAGTDRRVALCASKANLDKDMKRGMKTVWVNTRTNKIGSYIIGYTFIYK